MVYFKGYNVGVLLIIKSNFCPENKHDRWKGCHFENEEHSGLDLLFE